MQQANSGGNSGGNMNVAKLVAMTHQLMERLNENRRRDVALLQNEFRTAMTSVDNKFLALIAARHDNNDKIIASKVQAIHFKLERLTKKERELAQIAKQIELLYNAIN